MSIPPLVWKPAFLALASLCLALVSSPRAKASSDAVWQWSSPLGNGRAFLWIPEDCSRVRAVVVAQDNMIERGILEHAGMRRTLASLGIAEVFVTPPFDPVFRFDQGAGERLEGLLRTFAERSGYAELAQAPLVPLGHSACASFPWNLAAWKPERTLAVLSLKGDAPLTELTGSGKPNPEWGARNIDGIPGLMVMSEGEWWEDRLVPLLRFRAAHPKAPLALLADVGHGHFDATDALVERLALFLRKAVELRLPREASGELRAVLPEDGWLVERWRPGEAPRQAAAPYARYAGDKNEAFWCADAELAASFEALQGEGRGKLRQQVAFVQAGSLAPISSSHAGIELKFLPEADGLSFRLGGAFIEPLPQRSPRAAKDKVPQPTVVSPTKAAPDQHAAGDVVLLPITGPARKKGAELFEVAFDRTFNPAIKRGGDIWLLALNPGDARFKGAVQQALLRIPKFSEGRPQRILFPALPDLKAGTARIVPLSASSDAGAPVRYYVLEGPAVIEDGALVLTPVPPRAKFPLTITVVAWQLGRGTEPKLQTAEPVTQSFNLLSQ